MILPNGNCHQHNTCKDILQAKETTIFTVIAQTIICLEALN